MCLDCHTQRLFRLEKNQGLRMLQRRSAEKKGSQKKMILGRRGPRKEVVKILEVGKHPDIG